VAELRENQYFGGQTLVERPTLGSVGGGHGVQSTVGVGVGQRAAAEVGQGVPGVVGEGAAHLVAGGVGEVVCYCNDGLRSLSGFLSRKINLILVCLKK